MELNPGLWPWSRELIDGKARHSGPLQISVDISTSPVQTLGNSSTSACWLAAQRHIHWLRHLRVLLAHTTHTHHPFIQPKCIRLEKHARKTSHQMAGRHWGGFKASEVQLGGRSRHGPRLWLMVNPSKADRLHIQWWHRQAKLGPQTQLIAWVVKKSVIRVLGNTRAPKEHNVTHKCAHAYCHSDSLM